MINAKSKPSTIFFFLSFIFKNLHVLKILYLLEIIFILISNQIIVQSIQDRSIIDLFNKKVNKFILLSNSYHKNYILALFNYIKYGLDSDKDSIYW